MRKHFKQQVDSLAEVCESFDEKAAARLLDDCTEAYASGRAVVATALGKNVPLCEKFVGTLNSLGVRAHFMHTNSAIHGDLGIVQSGDVVVVLSKSGETEETVHLCNLLKERQTKNWLLTCNQESDSARLLENKIVLHVSHEGDSWNLVPNNSSIAFLVFLQTLCIKLIDELPVHVDTFKQNHPGGNIGKILRASKNK